MRRAQEDHSEKQPIVLYLAEPVAERRCFPGMQTLGRRAPFGVCSRSRFAERLFLGYPDVAIEGVLLRAAVLADARSYRQPCRPPSVADADHSAAAAFPEGWQLRCQ